MAKVDVKTAPVPTSDTAGGPEPAEWVTRASRGDLAIDEIGGFEDQRDQLMDDADRITGKIRAGKINRREFPTDDHAQLKAAQLREQAQELEQKLAFNDVKALQKRQPLRLEVGTTVYAPVLVEHQVAGRDAGWEVISVDPSLAEYTIKSEVTGEERNVGREFLEPVQPPELLVPTQDDIDAGAVYEVTVTPSGKREPESGWVVKRLNAKTRKATVAKQVPGEGEMLMSVPLSEIERQLGEQVAAEITAGQDARARYEQTWDTLADLETQMLEIKTRIQGAAKAAEGTHRDRAHARAAELAGEHEPGSLEYMTGLKDRIASLEAKLAAFGGQVKTKESEDKIKGLRRELGEAKYWAARDRAERLRQPPRYKTGDQVVIQHEQYGPQTWAVKEFVPAGDEFNPRSQDAYVVWATVTGPRGERKVEEVTVPREQLEVLQVDYQRPGAELVKAGDLLPIDLGDEKGGIRNFRIEEISGGIASIIPVEAGGQRQSIDVASLEHYARKTMEDSLQAKANMERAQRDTKE
jgi:hypothetical protein